MKISTLIEVISAAHVSYNLRNVPPEWEQRGGIMLVAPPGNMKTAIITTALSEYPNALLYSDLNVRQLVIIADEIANKKYRTLAFPDYEKIYKRDSDTSANVEGHIAAMAEEGFSHASFEDKRMFKREARALIVCGMVETLYRRKFMQWNGDGFQRRFLWCHYQIGEPEIISKAIHDWKPISFGDVPLLTMSLDKIPFDVTDEESKHILTMLTDHEGGQASPFVLMKKIFAVLKWRHRKQKDGTLKALSVLADFATCLSRRGGDLEI